MITPAFTGQYYQDTTTKKLWKSNSTTAGDWTAVGNFNKSGAGDPTGVATPDFTGQTYRDTATGNIWTSTGLTNVDWTLTVQDTGINWFPYSLLNTELDFNWSTDLTQIIYKQTTKNSGVNVSNFDIVTSITANNLTSIDPLGTFWSELYIYSCPLLTDISFPLLQTIGGDLSLTYCNALTSFSLPEIQNIINDGLTIRYNNNLTTISLPKLSHVETDVAIANNPALTTVDLSLFLPTDGTTMNFISNALNASSVNHVLARCVANAAYVSGAIGLNAGTNAAPSGQGVNDKNTLIARGVTVTTN